MQKKKQECGASIVEYEEEEKRGICPQTTNQPTNKVLLWYGFKIWNNEH